MGEKEMEREAPAAAKVSAIASRRPTITVPPRAPFESIFAGGSIPGYSPGPMTLLSSIFSPDSNSCSFSQLLAGAMASPIGKPTFLATTGDYSSENSSKDVNFADGNDKRLGYKQNRPMGLMVAQSPLFLVPPGLSPSGFLNSPGFLSPLQSPFGMSHQQALAHVTAQAALSQSFVQIQADFQRASSTTSVEAVELQPSSLPSETLQVHTVVPSDPQSLKMGSSEASQFDKKPVSSALDKPANDGYNWRKYGQKLVKAKEHPRSYYKCTHPQCPVKKKVERATDGQITEITYKGQHNHEVPQPNTRAKYGSGLDGTVSSRVKPEFGTRARTEIETSNEAATSHLVDLQHKVCTQLSSEPVPVVSEHDEMEDSATVIDEDNDVDEPNAKRRNMEVRASVPVPSHKTVTEPKIVVQTRSEVDLLDDGFKWRKYGQKVVKGNPHPRSYYRCTFTGCNVRKHVERASADPKEVITTYEGKHNHDIPAARNSSHIIVNTTAQLKPQKAVAKKPSLYREVDFQNKDQIPVLPQLKEGKIAA